MGKLEKLIEKFLRDPPEVRFEDVQYLLESFGCQLNYPITLYPEPDGGYTVMLSDLPGCMSQGDSLEEAIANIQEARSAWLETAWDCGDDIPLPTNQRQG